MTSLIGSLQQGIIYGLLALGIYISFRILNTPDLTADGSFTLGLSVSASLTVAGMPELGIVLAILAGAGAGIVTATLQTRFKIHPILSGILTMFGLYSVNLMVLGGSPNISLLGSTTIFTRVMTLIPNKDAAQFLVPLAFLAACTLLLIWFFRSHLGLCIRATGNNEDMVRASSINVSNVKTIGFAVSNACVALAGAVMAQYQRYADINSGVGIMVVGLASAIIGEAFFGRRSVPIGFLSAIVGSILYRFVITLVLRSDFVPAHALRLVSAVVVIIALSLPSIRHGLRQSKIRKEARKHAVD